MKKALLPFLVALAMMAGAQSTASAMVRYNITNLGYSNCAYGLNNSGQACGITYSAPNGHPCSWSGGVMTDLTGVPGPTGLAHQVNDSGAVVGYAQSGGTRGMIWKNGQTTDIGAPGDGIYTEAYSINNPGQVVGWRAYDGGHVSAFFWENGVFTDIGRLGGQDSHAYDINNQGQVVGTSWMADGRLHAYIWQDGQISDIGIQGNDVEATSINDFGQIAGVADGRAFFWQGGNLTYITSAGHFGLARSINRNGVVVGQYWGEAFAWQGGEFSNLNTLVDHGSGWILKEAFAVNDSGQIAGYGLYQGATAAFLLTPVPEPSSLLVLLSGAGVLSGMIWKRRRTCE